MDPWCRRRPLPVGYYYRHPIRRNFQQCYQEQTESLLVSHSRRNPIYLGSNSCWWNGPPSRGVYFLPNSLLEFHRLTLFQSPRYLIKKNRDADAARALSRLTSLPIDHPEVRFELEEIRLNLKHEEEVGAKSYMDCFRSSDNRIRFRTLTGISIQAWQQLTGVNFIFYFGTTFFTNAGLHNPFLISIATSTVNVAMTLPGIWGVERFGRRRLLLVGAVGMTVCEFIIAIIGSSTKSSNQSAQSTLVAFVCFYIAFFASTWGPITWVVTGEIFPLQIRAKAMSLSVASNWLWNWAIAYSSE
jgi:SP family sugar:H+ symporter-like MFS transporter